MSHPQPLSAEAVLGALGESGHLAAVAPGWAESMAVFPSALPRVLQPETIREAAVWGGLDAADEVRLQAVARRIAASAPLRQLAWHACWRVFDSPEEAPLRQWPSLERALGEDAGALYALVSLDLVPRLRALHGARGIPEAVTRDTCHQIWSFIDNYRRGRGGRFGMFGAQLSWMRKYTRQPLFRLGRLEFWLRPFDNLYPLHVYRHRRTGATVALAGDQARFTDDGFRNEVPADGAAPADGWTARLVLGEREVRGFPITPMGKCLRREIALPLADWACVLQPGDATLNLHIPAGGNLTPAACADAFRQAPAFFARYYRELAAPASITCGSWIFSPLIEEILPAESNLVKLLREVHLFPIPSGPDDGLWFIFFQDKFDPATAPRDSRLQCAMLDYLAAGHRWRTGAMFLLLDDLPHFGTQHYRAHWPQGIPGLETAS